MKKQYTITTGSYDNFEIVARIEGEDRPALSTLKKEFDSIFRFPETPHKPLTDGNDIARYVYDKSDAVARARKSGLKGDGWAELFVGWLVLNHGYVVIKDNVVWIG